MKATDLCDYLENRHLYEKTKNKRPEFAIAVQEIRAEAGITEDAATTSTVVQPTPTVTTSSSFGRIRKPSARISDKDFIPSGVIPLRKRQNSNSINFDFHAFDYRSRTDSTGSIFGTKRSKGPSITNEFGEFDLFHVSLFS